MVQGLNTFAFPFWWVLVFAVLTYFIWPKFTHEYFKKGHGLYLACAIRILALTPTIMGMGMAGWYVYAANYDSSSVTLKDYATIKTADAEYTGYITKNPLMDYVEILQIPQYPIILNCENWQELEVCREKPVTIDKSDITQLITHKSRAKG